MSSDIHIAYMEYFPDLININFTFQNFSPKFQILRYFL
ncbi:hypothetical protein LSO12E_100019 [Candidatus Liberibacter solanacearum]